MPVQPHEQYAPKSGIYDYEKFVEMKMAWMRISFRVRDYDSAIKFNNRNHKRKVCEASIKSVAEDIARRAHEFEKEFKIPFLDSFNKMLKP